MKIKVDLLKLFTRLCKSVLELSCSSSILYRDLENGEVAMIESAVIVKPVVIERNVEMVSKAIELLKLHTVENSNIIAIDTAINIILLIILISDFGN